MDIKLIRAGDVMANTGDSRSGMYARIEKGLLPPPVHRGRMAVWPAHEINAVNAAHIAGRDDAHIRALVRDLVAARSEADK